MENKDYQRLCDTFLKTRHSLIIAPAGFGKTYTIAEVLSLSKKTSLVLTHTNAGVAAIKKILRERKIDVQKYNVETIAGYCQKYVRAFVPLGSIPAQVDPGYYPFIYKEFTKLLKRKHILETICLSYDDLIVDEYQDCTVHQHNILLGLGKSLALHVLGDSLQGIYGFGGNELVNWKTVAKDFTLIGSLDKPWRWINTGNVALGEEISTIRALLEQDEPIGLKILKNIEVLPVTREDSKDFYKNLRAILKSEKNVLIIEPTSANKAGRLAIVKSLPRQLRMLESIDDKDFYHLAKLVDTMSTKNAYTYLLRILRGEKSSSGKWKSPLITNVSPFLKEEGPITSSKDLNRQEILTLVKELTDKYTMETLLQILRRLLYLGTCNILSTDLYFSLLKAISASLESGKSVVESMETVRNIERRRGRSVNGKVIGTTLLTKGLEMDCVVVLDADKFTDKENLYVAISRASKRLILFTEQGELSPYSKGSGQICMSLVFKE